MAESNTPPNHGTRIMSDVEYPPAMRMHTLLSGFVVSQAIFVVADLGVATTLLSGPCTIDEVAADVGADADALGRIIRFLAQHGVFRISADTVEITELGRTLADGPCDSLRKVACYFRQTHYLAFAGLLETVRTGEPAETFFDGKLFFDWTNDNPELAKLQCEALACFTQNARGDLLDVYDIPDGELIADIGGADGNLLVQLLASRPERRGIVYDLASCVSAARRTLRAAGLDERVEIIAGDFFDRVPAADVYVLSAVLQDWTDVPALRILRNIATAAPAHARLVVIDVVVPESDSAAPTEFIDITMLGMLGGRERSQSQWCGLLARAGFSLQRTVAGSGSYCALEAVLA